MIRQFKSFILELFKNQDTQKTIKENTEHLKHSTEDNRDKDILGEEPETRNAPETEYVKDTKWLDPIFDPAKRVLLLNAGLRLAAFTKGATGVGLGTIGFEHSSLRKGVVDRFEQSSQMLISPQFVEKIEKNRRNLGELDTANLTYAEHLLLKVTSDFAARKLYDAEAYSHLEQLFNFPNQSPAARRAIAQLIAAQNTRMGYAQPGWNSIGRLGPEDVENMSPEEQVFLQTEINTQLFVKQRACDHSNPGAWALTGHLASLTKNFVTNLDELASNFPTGNKLVPLRSDLLKYGAPFLHNVFYRTSISVAQQTDYKSRQEKVAFQIRLFRLILDPNGLNFPQFSREVWNYLTYMHALSHRSGDRKSRDLLEKIITFKVPYGFDVKMQAQVFEKGRFGDHMQQFFIINLNSVHFEEKGTFCDGVLGDVLSHNIRHGENVSNQRVRSSLQYLGRKVNIEFSEEATMWNHNFRADAFEGYVL